jgi:uncharacterized coiled-coil protein SlyX
MRSQQTPLSPAIKADKRFEALLKQEMREHEHLISSHNKEMQMLRDALKLAMEKFDSLFQKNEQDLKDFKTYTVSFLGIHKVKLESQEITIAEQKKTIEDLHKQLLEFQHSYASKEHIEKVKLGIEKKIEDMSINHVIVFQDLQREFKIIINSIKDDFIKFKYDVENRFAKVDEKAESNFHLSRLDKEGIERELIRYKKAMFYIEKKIENIYTLIERLNKRDALCHKQE